MARRFILAGYFGKRTIKRAKSQKNQTDETQSKKRFVPIDSLFFLPVFARTCLLPDCYRAKDSSREIGVRVFITRIDWSHLSILFEQCFSRSLPQRLRFKNQAKNKLKPHSSFSVDCCSGHNDQRRDQQFFFVGVFCCLLVFFVCLEKKKKLGKTWQATNNLKRWRSCGPDSSESIPLSTTKTNQSNPLPTSMQFLSFGATHTMA